MSSFLGELRRRNVFRVAGVYAVVGWVLTQIATTLEDAMQLPAWFDGVIVGMLLVGFPIALVFAWAFELTPEGVVRTEAVPEGESITDTTGRRLDYAIIAGLVVLVAMSAMRLDDPAPARAPAAGETPDVVDVASESPSEPAINAASIAVLPFADLSPAGDQEYFSDGIAEEILNVLVRTEGLEVTSRTSAFRFKDAALGIPEIARALRVRHVLEGSVRKSGATIRVTAQLIDAQNDKHLWSETFDRPLTAENIFAIQDEIAEAIVVALNAELGLEDLEHYDVSPTTGNLTAYELFLKAMPLFHDRIDLDKADEYLAQAVELDPGFSQALEIRSALQLLAWEYGYYDSTLDEAQRRAREFANRALQLEQNSATAIAMLANIRTKNARDAREREDIADILSGYARALDIKPRNAEALNWRGLTYMHVGYLEAALADFEYCVRYEPYYRPCVENSYAVVGAMGDDEASNALYLDALNTSAAKIEFAYLPSLARSGEELAFKIATNGQFMLRGWRRHDELWRAYRSPGRDNGELIESIRLYLDEHNEGLVNIFEYIAHPIGSGWRAPEVLVLWDAMMREYRQGPEFKEYMRQSGAYDYWRASGFPPQCRPVGDDDFACD